MEYMRMLQPTAMEVEVQDVRALAFLVAEWRRLHAFPVESLARLLVEDMSKWISTKMTAFFESNEATEGDLQLVWATGMSAEERRLTLARHVSDMMAAE